MSMTSEDYAKNLRVLMYCVTGFLCSMVVTFGGCTMHENYLTEKAIQHGASPLEAVCALSNGNGYPAFCPQVAQASATKK